jgi:dienelactone hydrolase
VVSDLVSGVAVRVIKRPVRENGLFGVLATPEGAGPAPGILLLGGSEGGLHERDAEVLAGRGFIVLALAYFGLRGLPAGLVEIPLEYFSRGLDLLAAEPRTGDRLGVTGASRGGEAALLIGSHDARVGAVVSVVGSGIVTPGIDFSLGTLTDILSGAPAAWTVGGRQLPHLPHVIPDEMRELIERHRPVRLALAFPPPPADPAELDAVSIPVERTNGAVLLISAADDGSWPSSAYSRVAMERLTAAGHQYPAEHRVLDAGHLIAGPPGNATLSTTTPGPGVTFEHGGTAAATSAARALAWRGMVEFFADNLS